MLQDRNISAADRAVMEFLFPDEALSVPDIARKYQVSRQHAQFTVNSLIDKGVVIAVENPRHRRSALMKLTRSGRSLFSAVLEQDKRAVRRLFTNVTHKDAVTTRKILQTVLNEANEETKP